MLWIVVENGVLWRSSFYPTSHDSEGRNTVITV